MWRRKFSASAIAGTKSLEGHVSVDPCSGPGMRT